MRRFMLCLAVMLAVMPVSCAWGEEAVLRYAELRTFFGGGGGLKADGSGVAINEENFPDELFRQYVSENFDADGNGLLTDGEISSAKSIKIVGTSEESRCESLKGIEYFTSLTYLYCWRTKLTELDLSNNTSLVSLDCYNNQFIVELDVSNNTSLRMLNCSWNGALNTIILSGCTSLKHLSCHDTSIFELDLSDCKALEIIFCTNTRLTSLDLSGCPALWQLWCSNSALTEIDLSKNTSLWLLYCDYNQLTKLDVSNCKILDTLYCDKNQLTALDVSNNTALKTLVCSNNKLTDIDVSKNTILEILGCDNNQLTTTLDVSKNTALMRLICSNNKITDIDVSKNVALTYLYCNDNQISKLNLSNNNLLGHNGSYRGGLYCKNNLIKSLDLTPCRYLDSTNVSCDEGVDVKYFVWVKPEITTTTVSTDLELGKSYSIQLTVTGTEPITLTTYSFPEGMTLDDSGLISWTPAKAGTYKFTIVASNEKAKDIKTFTVNVFEPITPKITTASIKIPEKGKSYRSTLKADGTKPITWSLASGDLPSGLSLNDAGVIAGSPNSGGEYSFTVKASNAYGEDTKNFSVQVFVPEPPKITTDSYIQVVKGVPFELQLKASGTEPISWSLYSGSLPSGLSLSESGDISGTPNETTGPSHYAVIEASSPYGKEQKRFYIHSVLPSAPSINIDRIFIYAEKGATGTPYEFKLSASGPKPITWSILSGKLPEGLTLDSSGLISGTPQKSGKYSLTVKAENAYGSDTCDYFAITVYDSVSITTKNLKAATIRKSYTAALKAKGTKPLTWSATGLPDGLTLNAKTGKISGKPTVLGTFSVKVTAQNSASSADEAFSLTVKGLAPKLSGNLAKAELSKPYSSGLKLTAGSLPVTWSCTGTLPDGLTFDTETGIISGTPTSYEKSGYKLKITAMNDAGSKSKNVTLRVKAIAPKITTKKLQDATLGSTYNMTLTATGSEPIMWTASGLPEGLYVYGNTITGTPTEAGNRFTVILYAENPVKSVKKSLTLKVNIEGDLRLPAVRKTAEESYSALPSKDSEETSQPQSGGYIIVTELGEISCDMAGMYEFDATLNEDAPTGWKLAYMAGSDNPSDDDEIAEFYDESGEEISAVPESRRITVSIWLNPGTIYKPQVLAISE